MSDNRDEKPNDVFVNGEGLFVDLVEKAPAYLKVIKAVEEEVSELQKVNGIKRRMGRCHWFWMTKQKILKEAYHIDWRTPAELNQNCRFD